MRVKVYNGKENFLWRNAWLDETPLIKIALMELSWVESHMKMKICKRKRKIEEQPDGEKQEAEEYGHIGLPQQLSHTKSPLPSLNQV